MANVSVPNDADSVAELLLEINSRSDLTTVHGAVAPGISPSELQPRWSSESHGASRTLLDADRCYIPFDIDKAPLAEGSAAGKGENLVAFAEQVRDEILPRAFRHCELVIRASSSTGLNPCRGSLHCLCAARSACPAVEDLSLAERSAGERLSLRSARPCLARPTVSVRPA